MYNSTRSSSASIVAGLVAAAGLFLATVVFGQSQDAEKTDAEQKQGITQEVQENGPGRVKRGRRGRRLKTIDELPGSTQVLTLENGKEIYFHEGQLFTFAEARSKYVQIPQALFTQQGRQQIRNGNRIRQAKMRDAQMHRRHNRRFHHGRRGPWT